MRRALGGLRPLLVQRICAVYMLLCIVLLLSHFVFDPPDSYFAWRDFIAGPVVGIAATVFVVALLAHAWVGVRDVILDYVHPTALRLLVLALLGLGLVGVGAWAIRILWFARG